MKNLIFLGFLAALFLCCGSKQEKVEKIIDDGVEVVVNHLDPYKIKGEPGTLHLEKQFSIDTEKEDMLAVKLTDIETFDVDQEKNIYIIQWQTKGNYIFKFGPTGNFLNSFLRFGQGPGEIEWGGTVLVNPQGEIIAKDPSKTKFLVYDRHGNFLRETHLERNYSPMPLQNGNYFIFWGEDSPEFRKQHVRLCSSDFKNVKELDAFQYPNVLNVKCPVNRDLLIYGVSNDRIYIGNSERGYEIRVYGLEGNLLQKIRKQYKPVEVSQEFEEAYFEGFPKDYPLRNNYYFTKYWPAFRDLFTDDEGRLFVLTYEEGINPGEYMYDVFNSGGVFMGRTSLGNVGRSCALTARAKKNRLYYIREKESGYKELVLLR